MRTAFKFRSYKYFPYEIELAAREVRALVGGVPKRVDDGFAVDNCSVSPAVASRFTYFAEVSSGERTLVPRQALLEASADAVANRQQTRYSAHGIHDYKGKFNPQIVRAALNIVDVARAGLILDPFCGSGTVLLEAAHEGHAAVGLDRNPLGVAIARDKVNSVRKADLVMAAARVFEARLEPAIQLASGVPSDALMERVSGRNWLGEFANVEFLQEWFPRPVLAQLAACLRVIRAHLEPPVQGLFRLFVSHVLRDVSLQDPADLRLRRRKDPAPNYDVIAQVVAHARRQADRISSAAPHLPVGKPRAQTATVADSTNPDSWSSSVLADLKRGVDAVITSPPYATALPYADTQRLSLAFLGLLTPAQIRRLDTDLLGSRDVRTSERRVFEMCLERGERSLPDAVIRLCKHIQSSQDDAVDGFRRKNMPGLLYRYFAGMKAVASAVHGKMKPGASIVMVVGPSNTSAGGQKIAIRTPELLAGVCESAGFHVQEVVPLQTYQRFSLHQENAIREEAMLIARKP